MKQSNVPLIPRKVIFGNPDHLLVRLSPGGTYLGWLAPRDGVLNVWVAPRDDLAAARPLTRDTGRGIRFFMRTHSGAHLLFLQDKNSDENWRMYAVDVTSGAIKDLTPFENTQARLMGLSHKFPEEIIVGLNNRNPEWHDIHRLNLVTGELTLLLQHERFLDVIVDNDYRLRYGIQMTPDGCQDIHVPAGADWELWDTIPQEDILTTSPVGFDKTNQILYMKDSRGRNTSSLVAVDLTAKKTKLLAEDARERRSARFLFTHNRSLENQPLVKMHPVIIRSRDGLDLVAYYSLPAGSDSDGDGIPDQPVPLVFVPHGGPWGRDFWGYHAWHQWLANRGYAVLSVNFRASTGFGKAFTNAGNTEEGRALLKQHSPLTCADRICRPLLIGQGAHDPRVKQAESDQIVGAMQAKNLPVTYVLYPDEGHGFARPENRLSFNAIAEAFLAESLDGCAEPIGGDFAGSSLTVPVGARHVPGLAEALAAWKPKVDK